MIYPVIYYSKHGNRARFCDLILLAATVDFFFVRLVRCCFFQAVAFILHHLSSCPPLLFLSSAYSPPAPETCPWISHALSICPAGTARHGMGTSGLVLVQVFALHCAWSMDNLAMLHCVLDGEFGCAALCTRWRIFCSRSVDVLLTSVSPLSSSGKGEFPVAGALDLLLAVPPHIFSFMLSAHGVAHVFKFS
jgi:hypothetical protein